MIILNFVYEYKYIQLGYFFIVKLFLFVKLKRKILYNDDLNFKLKW